LTPSQAKANHEGTSGAAMARPEAVHWSTLFIQRAGKKVREMAYRLDSDGYASKDLTILSEHISGPGFVQLCYAQEPDSVLYCLRRDGKLATLTYEPYHGMTDGKLADFIRVPLGGTKLPVKGENIDLKLNYVQVEDPEKLDEILSEIYLKNYQKVIITALQKSGYSIEEIDFLFTNQIKKSLLSSIFESLNLSEKNTFISLKDSGHLGAADTLFCLAKAMESEKIKPGNLVVLASSAAGFSWGATVIKY
ncbi:MAG: hypothetical protein F6K39_47775, partial [Okeania sp. SIO3B3]|nr:hypothetical protein [Okeania sp. SIO3B3]